MKINLEDQNLTSTERTEIEKLILKSVDNNKQDLEQMWNLMDLLWDEYGCDNKQLNWDNIGKFYSHPVWLLNGLFIEQHDESMGHRHAISDWIIKNKFQKNVDYGGGFGTLVRLLAKKNGNIDIDIYEPHPSNFGIKRASEFKNIKIIKELNHDYDCLVCTDVLEHVSDPLLSFAEMIDSVKISGYLVIANCFYPVIKCHLPQTFHLRYTFNIFARVMGLKVIGKLEGSHATIYLKSKEKSQNWGLIRFLEKISKMCFYVIVRIIRPIRQKLKS